MLIECSTCSQSGAERSNPQSEVLCVEPTSRKLTELDSASLRYKTGVANLSEMTKPDAAGEVTFACSQLAPRGGWRQRVGTERLRNLGDPNCRLTTFRESDGLIVVKKRGNSRGAKGTDCKREMYETAELRLPCAITELLLIGVHAIHNQKTNAYRKAGCGKSARPV